MGTRTLLRHVEPLAAELFEAAPLPGASPRSWREAHTPEAARALAAVIEGAWLVARIDGSVDRAERSLMADAVSTLTRGAFLSQDVDNVLDAAAAMLLREGLEARCLAVGATLAERHAAQLGMRVLLAVAAVSDGVSIAERVAVRAIGAAAGLSDGELETLRRETLAELAAPE